MVGGMKQSQTDLQGAKGRSWVCVCVWSYWMYYNIYHIQQYLCRLWAGEEVNCQRLPSRLDLHYHTDRQQQDFHLQDSPQPRAKPELPKVPSSDLKNRNQWNCSAISDGVMTEQCNGKSKRKTSELKYSSHSDTPSDPVCLSHGSTPKTAAGLEATIKRKNMTPGPGQSNSVRGWKWKTVCNTRGIEEMLWPLFKDQSVSTSLLKSVLKMNSTLIMPSSYCQ